MKRCVAILILLVAANAHAVYSSRRVVLPIAGRVSASGGREYATTLWITNRNATAVRARISFLPAGQANPEPQPVSVDVASQQTLRLENVTEALLRQPGKLGALLVEADAPLACTARLATNTGGAGFAAIPIELAIPRGGSTQLQGAGAGPHGEFRYNIHLVETNRSAIEVVVSLIDANGRDVGHQSVLLREHEALTMPVSKLSAAPPPEATVLLRVTKGSGKLVAGGSQLDVASGDPTAFEMVTGDAPRDPMPRAQLAAYLAAAVAIALAALARLRREERGRPGRCLARVSRAGGEDAA